VLFDKYFIRPKFLVFHRRLVGKNPARRLFYSIRWGSKTLRADPLESLE